jgi:ribose transport system substrate-binding protein
LVAVTAAAALALGVGACGSSSKSSGSSPKVRAAPNVAFSSIEQTVPDTYPQPKPGKYRLGYLNPEGGNEFLGTLGNAMRLETQKLGGSYVELDARGDVNTQVSQFDQLIAQKVNGIAVFALDPKSVAPDVARAKRAGIHLVTIDLNFLSPTALSGYESQVWQRRDEAAYDTGKYMAQHLAAGSTLGTIDFAIKVPSIVFSIDQDIAWAKQFGLKVAGNASNPTDDIAGGEKGMTTLLGQSPGIKGVMGYNDPSAEGAASASLSQGVSGLIFGGENGGSDAFASIKAGRETFSAKLDAPSMGKDWAWALYDLAEGTKIPPTVKAGAPVLIDKSNVNSVPTWQQQLKQEYPGKA